MLVCQLSDLHIKAARRKACGRVDTAGMLEACVAAVRALSPPPDAVVITGDLVDLGQADEYALLAELLAPLPGPVYLLPGNHDERGELRRAFPGHRYLPGRDPFLQYAIEDHALRLVALDTVIPGEAGGRLCGERLAWLERTLAARPASPTLVLMHHPPFRTGIWHMDRIGLDGAAALESVLRRHPQVERVLCGHLHRAIQTRFGGTLASTCPSPAHQVMLDLRPGGPEAFVLEPPGYQLHLWNGEGVVSHTAVIGAWDGPHPFHPGDTER